mmetsp:Transcript_16073/g.40838  ORF Transcript_16073/g.40838 Transcript_16073/m.40838 type:complete len:102 (+) Transcript_16073:220-525(+)
MFRRFQFASHHAALDGTTGESAGSVYSCLLLPLLRLASAVVQHGTSIASRVTPVRAYPQVGSAAIGVTAAWVTPIRMMKDRLLFASNEYLVIRLILPGNGR